MKRLNLSIIFFHFIFASLAIAGCPVRGIQNGNVEILKCTYSEQKPSGAEIYVNINYSNEIWMGEQAAKDLKAKIFLASEDKTICEKYEAQKKVYCMNLQEGCIMAGPVPHGARFIVAGLKDGKCVVEPHTLTPSTESK